VTASSDGAASGVPYATAMRKLKELHRRGTHRTAPRTQTGRSFSLHPSADLLERFGEAAGPAASGRIARATFDADGDTWDYFYGGIPTYRAQSIPPLRCCPSR
jgi:multiple sugar transport system substrate-binding protein